MFCVFFKPNYGSSLTLVCLNFRTDTQKQAHLVKDHKHPYVLIKSQIAFSSHFATYPQALLVLRVCRALCAGVNSPSRAQLSRDLAQGNHAEKSLPAAVSFPQISSHPPQTGKTTVCFKEPEECGCTHCEFCGHHDG